MTKQSITDKTIDNSILTQYPIVSLREYPTERDWLEVKIRAFETEGKTTTTPPTDEWKRRILEARHSPIRRLFFSFELVVPYWVSVHLVRHVHTQPYVQSQRNDRQDNYDRTKAPQDAPVRMIWDMNAESLIAVANKRLCNKASKETQAVVREMVRLVLEVCPEFADELVPMCVRDGGCHEMKSCGGYHGKKG